MSFIFLQLWDTLTVVGYYFCYYWVGMLIEYKGFDVDKPPVTTFILNEISNKFLKTSLQMNPKISQYILYVWNRLFNILSPACIDYCATSHVLRLDYVFLVIWDFLFTVYVVFTSDDPRVSIPVFSPTSSADESFRTVTFHKFLDNREIRFIRKTTTCHKGQISSGD